MSVWFITGASRGLGAAIAREALARGHQVAATGRDLDALRRTFPDAGEALLPLAADVTDEPGVRAAADAALVRFGRIDVLVNNAGRGLIGAVEEVSDEAARAVFDTNFFGVLTTQRAVLPTLRAQRSGHVINISSVGGFTGSPGWGLYAATKFALEGMSESLRAELAPLGVRVTIVQPGGFRTDFLDGTSLRTEARTIEDYATTSGTTREVPASYNHAQRGDPAKAAAAIVDLAELPEGTEPPTRLQLGADCVERVSAKLDQVREDLEAWRAVAVTTDHADQVTTTS
ncbi:oxidoreductase [Streptomyces lushanensis]|uniref:oxidoreductase n=1 Tax=Streptomyces lushanensis TaxID=1434255 RepID=UPI000834185D|nr:oxidoreductase [Streptomyces lushanensis]